MSWCYETCCLRCTCQSYWGLSTFSTRMTVMLSYFAFWKSRFFLWRPEDQVVPAGLRRSLWSAEKLGGQRKIWRLCVSVTAPAADKQNSMANMMGMPQTQVVVSDYTMTSQSKPVLASWNQLLAVTKKSLVWFKSLSQIKIILFYWRW